MSVFDDLFGGIFGSSQPEEVKMDLLTRITDLETAIAEMGGGVVDPVIMARIKQRCAGRSATDEQKAAFYEAWRRDLEMTLVHKNHVGESRDIAWRAFQEVQRGHWEMAALSFKQAHVASSHYHWRRSHEVCEGIAESFTKAPVAPLGEEETDLHDFDGLYTTFEITKSHEHLVAAVNAETPLEWLEHWHAWCESSLVFKGMIPEETMDLVRAGKWMDVLSYEDRGEQKFYGPGYFLQDRNEKTALGKHFKTLTDHDVRANIDRIWAVLFWGAGLWPPAVHSHAFKPHQDKEDGKWYIMAHDRKWRASDEKQVSVFTRSDRYPNGYDTEEELRRAVWRSNIYGGKF